jgi:hypothetical protein
MPSATNPATASQTRRCAGKATVFTGKALIVVGL